MHTNQCICMHALGFTAFPVSRMKKISIGQFQFLKGTFSPNRKCLLSLKLFFATAEMFHESKFQLSSTGGLLSVLA